MHIYIHGRGRGRGGRVVRHRLVAQPASDKGKQRVFLWCLRYSLQQAPGARVWMGERVLRGGVSGEVWLFLLIPFDLWGRKLAIGQPSVLCECAMASNVNGVGGGGGWCRRRKAGVLHRGDTVEENKLVCPLNIRPRQDFAG